MYFQLLLVASLMARAVAASCNQTSAVAFGVNLVQCTQPGTIAMTFDDGPFEFTDDLLAILAPTQHKVTFFVNGNNFAPIANFADSVKAAVAAGHQIGSHTFSHANLTALDAAGITQEITLLETELLSIIGVMPTWIRPPFLETGGVALPTLKTLGYHVVGVNVDTKDFENLTPDLTPVSVKNFQDGLAVGGTTVLAHDVHENTVLNLVPQLLTILAQKNLTSIPVGACFGDEPKFWYRTKR